MEASVLLVINEKLYIYIYIMNLPISTLYNWNTMGVQRESQAAAPWVSTNSWSSGCRRGRSPARRSSLDAVGTGEKAGFYHENSLKHGGLTMKRFGNHGIDHQNWGNMMKHVG